MNFDFASFLRGGSRAAPSPTTSPTSTSMENAPFRSTSQSENAIQVPQSLASADALAAAVAAGDSGAVSATVPKGRVLRPKQDVYNIDQRQPGEEQPQLKVAPITMLKTDFRLEMLRQIAVNSTYICYGLKAGHIRVLNKHTAFRALLKGHAGLVTDMQFFSPSSNLLASCGKRGDIVARVIVQEEGEIRERVLLRFPNAAPQGFNVKLAWHPSDSNSLAYVAGGRLCFLHVPDPSSVTEAAEITDPALQLYHRQDEDFTYVAFSPSGECIAVGSQQGRCYSWWLLGPPCTVGEPNVAFVPHDGQAVSTVEFVSNTPTSARVLTGNSTNSELKLWELQVPGQAQCLYCLNLEAVAPNAFYNHLVLQRAYNLVVLANSQQTQVFTIHFTDQNDILRFDYIAEFSHMHRILSLTTELDSGMENFHLYCVQTEAIQQYILDQAACIPPSEELATQLAHISRQSSLKERESQLEALSRQNSMRESQGQVQGMTTSGTGTLGDLTGDAVVAAPTGVESSETALPAQVVPAPAANTPTFITRPSQLTIAGGVLGPIAPPAAIAPDTVLSTPEPSTPPLASTSSLDHSSSAAAIQQLLALPEGNTPSLPALAPDLLGPVAPITSVPPVIPSGGQSAYPPPVAFATSLSSSSSLNNLPAALNNAALVSASNSTTHNTVLASNGSQGSLQRLPSKSASTSPHGSTSGTLPRDGAVGISSRDGGVSTVPRDSGVGTTLSRDEGVGGLPRDEAVVHAIVSTTSMGGGSPPPYSVFHESRGQIAPTTLVTPASVAPSTLPSQPLLQLLSSASVSSATTAVPSPARPIDVHTAGHRSGTFPMPPSVPSLPLGELQAPMRLITPETFKTMPSIGREGSMPSLDTPGGALLHALLQRDISAIGGPATGTAAPPLPEMPIGLAHTLGPAGAAAPATTAPAREAAPATSTSTSGAAAGESWLDALHGSGSAPAPPLMSVPHLVGPLELMQEAARESMGSPRSAAAAAAAPATAAAAAPGLAGTRAAAAAGTAAAAAPLLPPGSLLVDEGTLASLQQSIVDTLNNNHKEVMRGLGRLSALGEIQKSINKLETSINRTLEQQLSKLSQRKAEEERRRTAALDASLEKMAATIAASVVQNTTEGVQEATAQQTAALLAALTPALEATVGSTVGSALQASLGAELAGPAMQGALQSAVGAQLKMSLFDTLRRNFEVQVIPAFEKATQSMFGQIEAHLKWGLAEHLKHAASTSSEASLALRESTSQVQALTVQLANVKSELGELQVQLTQQVAAAAAATAAATSAAAAAAATPAPAVVGRPMTLSQLEEQHDPKTFITNQLRMGQYEEAFGKALSLSNLETLMWMIRQLDYKMLGDDPCPLTQPVLLSLVQQLAFNLQDETELKLEWILEAAHNLEPADKYRNYMQQVLVNLNNLLNSGPQADLGRKTKLCILLIKNLLA